MPRKMSASHQARTAFFEPLEDRTLLSTTVGGVDPNNMGKGDWIWQVSAAETNTGTTTVQGLVNYLKAEGFKWLIVKAGDGNNGPYAQFDSTLINDVHSASMKIFAYQFTYGGNSADSGGITTTQAGEKTAMHNIMALNPDGLVVDAEGAWESVANANTVAEDYGKDFKTNYPTKLLAYAPFAYTSLHPNYPYVGFGKYADVVMPQDYWKTISIAQTPQKMVADMDTNWKALYTQMAAQGHADSIKPIVPIGQGYNTNSSNPTPGSEITQFYQLLRADSDPASPFGYNGVSFWSVQHHTADIWAAIGSGTLTAAGGSISGAVFNDIDGNGVRSLSEGGVAGRIVYDDTNNDGIREAYEPFVKTNSTGNFTLSYRGAGIHRIREEVPAGWRQTSPANLLSNTVSLSNSQTVTDIAFGNTQQATITGNVFNDHDANGAKDSTDESLANRVVFLDANNNGVLDAHETSVLSDAKGNYTFNVAAGSYEVREIPSSGYRITTPASTFYDVALTAGQSTIKFFGNSTNVLISGFVFNDRNGDGIKEPGDAAMVGWRVFLDLDGDGVFDSNEPTAITDAVGKFRFMNVGGGTYRIRLFIPTEYAPTLPGSAARKITLANGGTTSNKNFGVTKIA